MGGWGGEAVVWEERGPLSLADPSWPQPLPGGVSQQGLQSQEASMEAVVSLSSAGPRETGRRAAAVGGWEQPLPSAPASHWADVPHPPPASFSTTP